MQVSMSIYNKAKNKNKNKNKKTKSKKQKTKIKTKTKTKNKNKKQKTKTKTKNKNKNKKTKHNKKTKKGKHVVAVLLCSSICCDFCYFHDLTDLFWIVVPASMVRTGGCCASFILQIFVEPAWAGFASQHGQDWGMPHILHFTDFCSASQPPLTNGQGPCGPSEQRMLCVTDQRKEDGHGYDVGSSCAHSSVWFVQREK